MTNIEKYKNIFIRVFDVREDSLNESFTFADTEKWDSLGHITLISELENEFDVMFDTEDILSFGSFENGMKILKKYRVSFDN